MKQKTFILIAAAVATLGIAACEREEEPMGSPSGGGDTIPAVDTIPTVDTTPAHPWYQSLVGTRWLCRFDQVIGNLHDEHDEYFYFVDDSTIEWTNTNFYVNGYFMDTTFVSSHSYAYYPDELKLSLIFSGGTKDYYLDTIQKSLSIDMSNLPNWNPIVFYLIEE